MKTDLTINSWRENAFFICLLIFVVFLPFSEALVSIAAGILLFQALALSSWKHPSVPHGSVHDLLLILSVFLVYLIGMVFTKDISFAFYELKKVIFWLVIPVAFFISPHLDRKRFTAVTAVFCLSVFLASLVATGRMLFSEQMAMNGFRSIFPVSHIRFSFQLILAMILTAWLSRSSFFASARTRKWLVALLLWFLVFLFLLKSITGIIAFLGTVYLMLIIVAFRRKRWQVRFAWLLLMVLLAVVPLLYVGKVWHDFYSIQEPDPDTIERFTPSGNPYSHNFSSREKENGHWVNLYICEKELRQEWNEISSIKYDEPDGSGYTCSGTLIRYLTGKGLRKDSTGVSLLTPEDVSAIEKGIANHIFAGHPFSLYPRIYETIWEYDRYSYSGNPNDQSFSQRIEFVKASLLLIRENPLFGIGTGNWKLAYAETYKKMNSQLRAENMGPSHNQFLNYLVKFGIAGFLFIVTVLLIPVFRGRHRRNLLFILFLIFIGFANFGDANLETHMGLSFFCFFYSLFLWHSPEEVKETRF